MRTSIRPAPRRALRTPSPFARSWGQAAARPWVLLVEENPAAKRSGEAQRLRALLASKRYLMLSPPAGLDAYFLAAELAPRIPPPCHDDVCGVRKAPRTGSTSCVHRGKWVSPLNDIV